MRLNNELLGGYCVSHDTHFAEKDLKLPKKASSFFVESKLTILKRRPSLFFHFYLTTRLLRFQANVVWEEFVQALPKCGRFRLFCLRSIDQNHFPVKHLP